MAGLALVRVWHCGVGGTSFLQADTESFKVSKCRCGQTTHLSPATPSHGAVSGGGLALAFIQHWLGVENSWAMS